MKLGGYINFYAYALLENHFHFAISICSEEEIIRQIKSIPIKNRKKTETTFLEVASGSRDLHKLIATQWSRVFNSYTQAINKKYNRKGNLFHTPFKRSVINYETKFTYLIYYIHHNRRKHGGVKDFLSDPWHSYHELVRETKTFLDRQFIIEWFGDLEAFIKFHKEKHLHKDFDEVWIE